MHFDEFNRIRVSYAGEDVMEESLANGSRKRIELPTGIVGEVLYRVLHVVEVYLTLHVEYL